MNTNITIGFLLTSLIQQKEIELIQTIIFLILSVTAGPLWRQHSAMRWDINCKLVALLCFSDQINFIHDSAARAPHPHGHPCIIPTWLPVQHIPPGIPTLAGSQLICGWMTRAFKGRLLSSPHHHYHHGSPSANFTCFKIGLRFLINCQKEEERERGCLVVALARAFILSYSIRRKCAWNFLYVCVHSFPLCVEACGLDGSHCLVCYV